jgi:5-methylcytosine-specific restriction endonuclease McrA
VSIGKARQGASQPSGQWIRTEKRLALYIRDRFQCVYCGADLRYADPAHITLDHLLPRSAGGGNDATNLVTACRPCNSSRQDRPWLDYATGGARDRIEQQRHAPLNVPLAKAILSGEQAAQVADLERAR